MSMASHRVLDKLARVFLKVYDGNTHPHFNLPPGTVSRFAKLFEKYRFSPKQSFSIPSTNPFGKIKLSSPLYPQVVELISVNY
jgi:hypothetical protein